MFTRTFVLFSSIHNTSFRKNTTKPTPRQAPICHLSRVTPWGGVVVPPHAAPPGEVLPHLCGPLSAPSRCARGALAGPVAPRCARGLCGMRGRGPAGRIERRPRAASPPGGLAALAPGAPASPPSAASPRPPARPPAPVARGPGAPPGSPLRRLGGRRLAPGALALGSGFARLRAPFGCPCSAAPLPSRFGLPSGAPPPAPPLRGGCALRACPRSSRRGPPARLGAQRPRAPGRLRRAGGCPRRWLRLVGAAVVVGSCACGRGVGGFAAVSKVRPSLPPAGTPSLGLDAAAAHQSAFAALRGAPARAL